MGPNLLLYILCRAFATNFAALGPQKKEGEKQGESRVEEHNDLVGLVQILRTTLNSKLSHLDACKAGALFQSSIRPTICSCRSM